MTDEREQEQERLALQTENARQYYDYEGRFIKQKLEAERMAMLPRIIKPSMFPLSGFVLGGLRTFDRYTVGPISSLTGSFVELAANDATPLGRILPAQVGYVVSGSGSCEQEGRTYDLATEDAVVIPSYTTFRFRSGPDGLKLWMPQVRLWHVIGLLWQEFEELGEAPAGTRPLTEGNGQVTGFEVPAGTLGLEHPLPIRAGADARRRAYFDERRKVTAAPSNGTRYDWFIDRLVEENRIEREAPRVVKGVDLPFEASRQGKTRFYLHPWAESAVTHLDLMVQEIEPGGASGRHRHIPEEILLVLSGRGHDLHEETEYPWEAGDVICVPTMASHQHVNDGDEPARLVSVWPRERTHQFLGGFEQIEDATSWAASH